MHSCRPRWRLETTETHVVVVVVFVVVAVCVAAATEREEGAAAAALSESFLKLNESLLQTFPLFRDHSPIGEERRREER